MSIRDLDHGALGSLGLGGLRNLGLGGLRDLDHGALMLARVRVHSASGDRAVAAYSRLGEHAGCWLALGGAGALLAREDAVRRAWLRGVRVVCASYGLNFAVKLAVRRRRPELEGLPPLTPTVSRLSFPSAHATTSFAAARSYRGLAPAAVLYPAAVAFALSRPYLGVHYPGDVLAGALLGTAVAELWPAPPERAGEADLWPAPPERAAEAETRWWRPRRRRIQ